MIPSLHFFYVARFVLQTKTPLSIGTGQGEGRLDTLLVRDANQLPAIPGTSLAGVLRHLHLSLYKNKDENRRLFGGTEKEDRASRVHVSWGFLHDSDDHPIQGLCDLDLETVDDPVLQVALRMAPVLLEHVRIDSRGVAEEGGQFNRTALCRGHRFSLEMAFWSQFPNDPRWEQLLGLLVHPEFRLGGATRSGLGAMKLVRLHWGCFNMRDKGDFARYGALSQDLADIRGLESSLPLRHPDDENRVRLELIAEEPFRFGQGTQSLTGENLKLLPQTETVIRWKGGRGSISHNRVFIPASAVKGALRHRTQFHYNLINNHFAKLDQTPTGENDESKVLDQGGLSLLFGYANEETGGQAGILLFEDLYLAEGQIEAGPMMHNGIDRFTGGVRRHVLYGEELLFLKKTIRLDIYLSQAATPPTTDDESRVWGAFFAALDDLVEGRLALGGGANRGHGYFQGKILEVKGGQVASSGNC